MKKPIIILTGPTAVGKTKASIELAKKIGGEIISADSMQVYKYMDIGSAKIRSEKIYANGHIPIVVGGTGFYIQALLYDIDFTESNEDSSYREELERLAKEKGAQYLHEELRKVDEKSAETIHANNVKRVIRALEFFKQTGQKISEHNETERTKESPYDFCYFVLTDDRKLLYDRINLRVDQMVQDGLLQEVQSLKERGYTKDMVSMQGLGYKEILDYLDGDCTLEEAIYILKRDTRHFAKRQLTWFRRERDVIWIDKSQYDHNEAKVVDMMITKIQERIPYICLK